MVSDPMAAHHDAIGARLFYVPSVFLGHFCWDAGAVIDVADLADLEAVYADRDWEV